MRMDLGTRNTLLYDFMHCMTAVSLEMSDEPDINGSRFGKDKPCEHRPILVLSNVIGHHSLSFYPLPLSPSLFITYHHHPIFITHHSSFHKHIINTQHPTLIT